MSFPDFRLWFLLLWLLCACLISCDAAKMREENPSGGADGGILKAEIPSFFATAKGQGYGRDVAVDEHRYSYLAGRIVPRRKGVGGAIVAKMAPWGSWLWSHTVGSFHANAIAVDAQKSVVVAGQIYGSKVTFGTFELSSKGQSDLLIAKLDAMGKWLWAKRAGNSEGDVGIDSGEGVAVDAQGNIYITGYFSKTAEFGPHKLTSKGARDVFVAKLDPSGTWLWAKGAGSANADSAYDIALDPQGNIYITGFFWEEIHFGSSRLTSKGKADIFVAKMDPSGKWLWAKRAGSTAGEVGLSIAVDPQGNTYITGYFHGTVDFGGTRLSTTAERNLFVAKLGKEGQWLWAAHGRSPSWSEGRGIAVDGLGNAHVTGTFREMATLGPTRLTSTGKSDILVAKLDPSGKWLRAKQRGSSYTDEGNSIAVDTKGSTYIAGGYKTRTTEEDGYKSDIFLWKRPPNPTDANREPCSCKRSIVGVAIERISR